MTHPKSWENEITHAFTRGGVVILNSFITGGREDQRLLHAYLTPTEARKKAELLLKAAEKAESYARERD